MDNKPESKKKPDNLAGKSKKSASKDEKEYTDLESLGVIGILGPALFLILAVMVPWIVVKYHGHTTMTFASTLFNYINIVSDNSSEAQVISSWNHHIVFPRRKQFKSITLGVNTNVDLIVSGSELLASLSVKPGLANNHVNLTSLDDLQEIFAHFLAKSHAAERHFDNLKLFNDIVKAADGLPRKEYFIGGNAGLMAEKIASVYSDKTVTLVGPIGPKLSSLLHRRVEVPEDSLQDEDEVHLIMEYKVGEEWGEHRAAVANRFITSHDVSNINLNRVPLFFQQIIDDPPDLVILTGLHMLQGSTVPFEDKVQFLAEGLRQVKSPVHLELASMTEKSLGLGILQEIVPLCHSLGLNEQELTFLSHIADGPHANLFYNMKAQPRIWQVVDIMYWLLSSASQEDEARLSRIHFHTLTFHVVATYGTAWGNQVASCAAAARVAGQQACDDWTITARHVELRLKGDILLQEGLPAVVNASDPIMEFDRDDIHFIVSPVLVCKNPVKTVGLGDAISATGLMYSEYIPSDQ